MDMDPKQEIQDFLSVYSDFSSITSEEIMHNFSRDHALRHSLGIVNEGIIEMEGVEYFLLQSMLEYTELSEEGDDLLIAFRDFYTSRGTRFPEFAEQVSYLSELDMSRVGIKIYFLQLFVGLLFGGVKCGDAYSTSVLKVLYQTYFKKEYKVLKKFPSLNPDDLCLFNEADDTFYDIKEYDPDSEPFPWSKRAVSRALCMSYAYSIDTSRCAAAYHLLHIQAEKEKAQTKINSNNEAMEILKNEKEVDKEKVREYLTQNNYKLPLYNDVEKLIKSFAFNCCLDTDIWNAITEMSTPEISVQVAYPDIARTPLHSKIPWEEQMQLLAPYYPLMDFISNDIFIFNGMVRAILNQPDDEQGSSILRSAKNLYSDKKKKGSEASSGRKFSALAQAATAEIRKSDAEAVSELEKMEKENKELKERLRAAQNDNDHLHEQLDKEKEEKEEMERALTARDAEHSELISLRNFVYKETEDDIPEESPISYEEMKSAVANKTILIIGGNDNWVKKIRNEFPKWKFVAANVSPSVSAKIIKTCDKAYFFTDTLGHSNYAKFVSLARIHNKDFSYMHGVNLQKNVRQVYEDFFGN